MSISPVYLNLTNFPKRVAQNKLQSPINNPIKNTRKDVVSFSGEFDNDFSSNSIDTSLWSEEKKEAWYEFFERNYLDKIDEYFSVDEMFERAKSDPTGQEYEIINNLIEIFDDMYTDDDVLWD